MSIINSEIENYIKQLQPMCKGELGEIQEYGYENNFPIIPNDTVRFLGSILAMKRPKTILEIGCCIGFSSSFMSMYLAQNGHITTIDRYDLMILKARKNFKKLGLEEKITLLEGDAKDILPSLNNSYDFIFLDANKGQYINYFNDCIRLLNVGGVLIADDIFQNGNIAKCENEVPRRQRTIYRRMKKFLDLISNTDGLETSIVPVGDGIVMCVKTKSDIFIKENIINE